MKKKIKFFVYEYSKNSRIKSREVSKRLKISQQSASYLLASLKRKKTLFSQNVLLDPSKFGYLNLLVYYNFSDFSNKNVQEIISYLKNNDYVVSLELISPNHDLACIYSVPNLSFFNKLNKEFLQSFKTGIFLAGVFPVVVKHIYPKNYLLVKKEISEVVVCGDRDIFSFSENEKAFLKAIYNSPESSIVDLSRKLTFNPKTVLHLKQRMEQNKVIRGYSAVWNYQRLGISRKHILLTTEVLDAQDDRRLLEFAKLNLSIISLTRLIGNFDFLVEVEGENLILKDVLKELRSEFNIKAHKVMEVDQVLKEKYLPESALL